MKMGILIFLSARAQSRTHLYYDTKLKPLDYARGDGYYLLNSINLSKLAFAFPESNDSFANSKPSLWEI